MHITKKNLLSLIKENLEEMAMDFDSPDRPHPDVTGQLATGDTPLKKVPFPKTNNPNQNFQEKLASERYREVINNLRRYTGVRDTMSGTPNMRLMRMMFDAHNRIIQIERNHTQELIDLALEVVSEDMGITKDDVNFVISLNSSDQIRTDDFVRDQPNQQNPEEVNPEEDGEEPEMQQQNAGGEAQQMGQEIFNDLKTLNLERAKQRLLNAISQGASARGHYLYHMVPQRLREITGSDELINLYGIMMSINDSNYWQFGDNTISDLSSSMAGKVDVRFPQGEQGGEEGGGGDEDGEEGGEEGGEEEGGEEGQNIDSNKPTVIVNAVNFPVLIHEIMKGAWKVLISHGQPKLKSGEVNKELFAQVKQHENTLEKELWDLRLGPAIWARLRESIPEDVLLDNDKSLQNYLFMNIFQLPAKEFLVLMKEVISNSDRGKQLLSTMIESIREMFRQEDYEATMQQFQSDLNNASEESDDDDLRDFLGGLGIELGPDDEE
jgi:hypothetical protein